MEALKRWSATGHAIVETEENKRKSRRHEYRSQYTEARKFFDKNFKEHTEQIERRSKEGHEYTPPVFEIVEPSPYEPPYSLVEDMREKLCRRCDALELAVKHLNRHGTYDARLVVDRAHYNSCNASFRWSTYDTVSLIKDRFVGKIRRFLADAFSDSHP